MLENVYGFHARPVKAQATPNSIECDLHRQSSELAPAARHCRRAMDRCSFRLDLT